MFASRMNWRACKPRIDGMSSRLSETLRERIEEEIATGKLAPGTHLDEVEMTQRFGVSRTPVREALLRLADLGLVDIYPQSGTRVAPIRIEKVRAAQLIREAVEVEIVGRAALEADAETLARLETLIDDQRIAAGRGDIRRLFELDEAFHRAIFAAAGFLSVSEELEDLRVHLDRLRYISVAWPRPAEFIVREHTAILAGMAARDAVAAAAAMRAHLRAVLAPLAILSQEMPQAASG